ncbi:MAG: hypothetical protein FWC79_01875 [Oscillospiraceae bacterium]|nr:hypothetical protein [Oscillospiraceae bacterium]
MRGDDDIPKLPDDKIKIIEDNTDKFLAGQISLTKIGKLAGTGRAVVSKYMKQGLENDSTRLAAFERLTAHTLTPEQLKTIEDNIDGFLAGKITITEIATMINAERATVSRNMKKLISDPKKLEEFEKLTAPGGSAIAERYRKKYEASIKKNLPKILSGKMAKVKLAEDLDIDERTLDKLVQEIY